MLDRFPLDDLGRGCLALEPLRQLSLISARQSLVMDAMLLLSKTLRASWSIGLAAALLVAVPSGHIAMAENMVGGTSAALPIDAASEGAFRHLRALQDIASVSGGNRAAGTPDTIVPRSMWRIG